MMQNSAITSHRINQPSLILDEDEDVLVGMSQASPYQPEAQSIIGDINHFKEECIHLISFNNETQKFEVSQAAKQMLSKVKGPLGVIAVAGMYRTGKSYLLNRMLLNRQKGGFGVGPSINPCTKGLWLWGTPVPGTTPDGQPLSVLVVDSEGIGGLDEDNNHDMRIFSLALLLSSYFLYNSVGSIDENALSSLSLVVNITKHIHLKSTDIDESTELSDYLPSFMWVVRDFALQLCNEHGTDITSKEYLERALTERGQADDQKNEVRRALKLYFKDRQCCTMIRPLTNEEELQNLEKTPLEELRAEFIEQVYQLRKAVLQNIKPKQINGNVIDGHQWISLIELYVEAINQGAVPSIQSAWTYICKQGASQVIEQAKIAFENELSSFIMHLPMNQEDLEVFLRDQLNALSEELQQQVKGDPEVVQESLSQLQQYLNSRTQEVLNENRLACKRYATDLLGQLFQELSQQLNQQLLPNGTFDLAQLDAALQEVASIYDQNALDFGSGGSEKSLLLAEAKALFLQDLLHQVGNQLSGEISLQRNLDSQTKDRLELQLRELKEDARLERQRVEERVKNLLHEKSELEAQSQLYKDQLDMFRQTRDSELRDIRLELCTLREQSTASLDQSKQAREDLEERVSTLQREKLQVESEFEKERALFAQKVEYLERTIAERAEREKGYVEQIHTKRAELSGEIRAVTARYEGEVRKMQEEVEEERERVAELERENMQREGEIEALRGKMMAQETTYKLMLNSAQEQLKSMEQTLQALKKDSDLKASQVQSQERIDSLQSQLQQLQESSREQLEAFQLRENESLKEKALREQKIHFLEVQLQDTQRQLEEAHKHHEHMVKAMKGGPNQQLSSGGSSQDSDSEDLQQEINRLKEEHSAQMFETMQQQEALHERIQELELQAKLAQKDHESTVQDYESQLSELEQVKSTLQEKVKSLEQQRSSLMNEQGSAYEAALKRFESELELQTHQSQNELREAQQNSEAALQQLRAFYEAEKDKLEQRISEEREKNTRRLAQTQEEWETRMREEAMEREEEMEQIQAEMRESEARQQEYTRQIEHELSLARQMCEALERQARESRDRAELQEVGRNTAFERQLEHFEQQRQEYNQKIDKLQLDNIEKDRALSSLQLKLERQGDDIERRKLEFDQSKSQFERERKTLSEKLEVTKRKLGEAQDECMKQKLEFGREQALSKQQIEFQMKKIDELQKQVEDSQRFYDEKLKHFRADMQDETQSQIERITSEKELWENKYEQKRRALKEIEQSLSRANTDLEKRLALLQSQLEKVEAEKKIVEEQLQEQVNSLQEQLQALDSSAGAAFYYGSAAHAEDVMKLRGSVSDLERELSDLQCAYDRDKALWEGKCQFLEQQKDTYKRDLIESQKKFEITLEQLQKRGSIDKDKQETSQSAILRVIESKYQAKIREMMDTHTSVVGESQSKVRRLESDLKTLTERLHLEQRGKHSEQGSLEKKLSDLTENERRLNQEIEELKQERDRRVSDFHKQLDKEKGEYRQRMNEYETKVKEAEKARSQYMFEYEKERARWQLERDGMGQKVQEMEDQVAKLVMQKEALMKENTRMKVESKTNKRIGSSSASNYGVGQSMMFGNSGVTAQQFGQHVLLMPQSNTSGSLTAAAGGVALHNNSTTTSNSSRYANQMMLSSTQKSLSGAVGNHIINQQINKLKENTKPISDDGLTNLPFTSQPKQQQQQRYQYPPM